MNLAIFSVGTKRTFSIAAWSKFNPFLSGALSDRSTCPLKIEIDRLRSMEMVIS